MSQAPDPMTRDTVRPRGARPPFLGLPLDPVTIAIALIIVGIALRAFIAGVALPYSGFSIDVGDFTAWAQRLADAGPGQCYQPGYFSDYPPGYLYVLWLLGSIGHWLNPIFGADITRGLVKIPGILADGGVAWMLFVIGRRYGAGIVGSWSGERVGLVAAAIFLFNPATIFDSAVWGQIDAVGALTILVSLYFLARGWTELSAVGAVLALLVKFQYAFVIPIVAIVGLKRHLFGRSTDPEHDANPDPLRVLTSLAAGLGTLVLLIWPFGMAVWTPNDPNHSLIDKFTEAANTYSGLTINAFNLWRNPFSGLGDTITWGCDTPSVNCTGGAGIFVSFGSFDVTWQLVGFVLFGIVAVLAYWQVARRDDARGLLVSALVLATAFFALPTRVHERYLFPAIALAAPLVLRSWRWALLFVVISVSIFTNVYWVYTADWSFVDYIVNPGVNGQPMARDPVLQAVLFSDLGVYLLSWMIVVALGFLVWRSLALARAPSEADAERAPVVRQSSSPPPPPSIPAPAATMPAGAPGRVDRFRAWLRPDPLDPYLRERGRRIDRLDLLLLVGLMLFALLFRLWRLDTPRGMHFDEVYHARSATEWLSDWEHGWTRDVYEWTHPMLAKYLIAAGIVVADPNKVVASQEVDEPVTAMAVAPQRPSHCLPTSSLDRFPENAGPDCLVPVPARPESVVFTASGGATITARDALSGELLSSWDAAGPVTSLVYDEASDRLLVGRADTGDINVFSLGVFLSQSGTRAPPAGAPPLATGLPAVSEVWLSEADAILLARGPDGIAELESVSGVELARTDQVLASVAYVPAIGSGDSTDGPWVVGVDPTAGVLALLDGTTLEPKETPSGTPEVRDLPGNPIGPIQVRGRGTDLQVWVLLGSLPADDEHPDVAGGMTVFDENLGLIDTAPLPGRPAVIGWQSVANIMYIAGTSESGAPELWTVQPIGNGGSQSAGFATFDTTPLDGPALALGFDVSDHDQDADHARLIVATTTAGGGSLVGVDASSNAFAWRLAGVFFGSVLVGLIYLLAASMFRRRRIAVLAAAFVAFDAMSYVMSRIAMNDIFVATFIVAAYLLFWQIWSGRWARSAWWALPLVGVLIGLAAATKWVGIYALLGIWVLVLARSALGRLLLVAGVAIITVVGGVGAPWPFLVICLAALTLALMLVWIRPIRLQTSDLMGLAATAVVVSGLGLAFTVAYGQVEGAREARNAVELVFGVLARGAQAAWPAWIMLGAAGLLILLRAVASLRAPSSDRAWMQPGSLGGFSWPWIGACLAVLPLLIYFLAYVPYLQLGHNISGPSAGPGYGWSLDELHSQMFGYHFGLQAGHPAASPWWSWPLDLKTVWFYGHDFDGRRIATIYNGGNPILFWTGVPAIVWISFQAWRRRSPALVLLVAAFAFQFLPWTRIERATFEYHYLTAVLFAMVAVAYVVDEALRSWSWRPFAIAFLVLAVAAGVLIFPLGSALAMPDWYINAARGLLPWNYAFVFPDPPTGDRGELISANTLKLAMGTVVAVGAAAWALFGRELLRGAPHGDDEEEDSEQHEPDRPEAIHVDRHVLADEEVGADADEDQPEDQPPVA